MELSGLYHPPILSNDGEISEITTKKKSVDAGCQTPRVTVYRVQKKNKRNVAPTEVHCDMDKMSQGDLEREERAESEDIEEDVE